MCYRYIRCVIVTPDVLSLHSMCYRCIRCVIVTPDVLSLHSMCYRCIRCVIVTPDVLSLHSMCYRYTRYVIVTPDVLSLHSMCYRYTRCVIVTQTAEGWVNIYCSTKMARILFCLHLSCIAVYRDKDIVCRELCPVCRNTTVHQCIVPTLATCLKRRTHVSRVATVHKNGIPLISIMCSRRYRCVLQ